MKYKYYLVLILVLLIVSCKDAGDSPQASNPNEPIQTGKYVPGHVSVGFIDSVNYSFISNFFQTLNLEPTNIYADSSFGVWIRMDSGNVSHLVARLEQDSAIMWADQRGYEGGDPLKAYLLIQFRGTVGPDYALQLIRSIQGISWQKIVMSSRMAFIKVEIGQENRWIDSLKTYPFVTWAELDYIIHVTAN